MFERKLYRADMLRCVLCSDAPCSKACGKLDVSATLRSIWFDDEKAAASCFPAQNPCTGCPAPCEEKCVRPYEVPIRALMTQLHDEVKPELEIPLPEDEYRLHTELCGIPLENPFLLSSSVVASTYDMCARAFEAGWAGVAFKTICSFDIHEASPRFSAITGDNGSIIGFKNIEQLSDHSVAENIWRITAIIAICILLTVSILYAFGVGYKSAAPVIDGKEALSLWNEGTGARDHLIDYVSTVTEEGGADYIPVEDRIAVFDMDGTLTCETFYTYYDSNCLAPRLKRMVNV